VAGVDEHQLDLGDIAGAVGRSGGRLDRDRVQRDGADAAARRIDRRHLMRGLCLLAGGARGAQQRREDGDKPDADTAPDGRLCVHGYSSTRSRAQDGGRRPDDDHTDTGDRTTA